jgi:hypothetical protein
MIRATGMTFGNRSNAVIALETLIQAANIEKRAHVYDEVDLGENERSKSFLHQVQTFSDQMEQLRTNLGESILPSLNDYLLGFNSKVMALSSYSKDHPWVGKAAEYGAETFMVLGGISLMRLFYTHMLAWPLRMLGSMGWLAAGTLGGLFGGTKALFGGLPELLGIGAKAGGVGMDMALLSATSGRVGKWLGATGAIGTILGDVGKLMGLLTNIFMAYQLGTWALNTKTGASMYETFKKELDAILHPSTSHAKQQLAREAYWQSDAIARKNLPWLAEITKAVGKPRYLQTLIGDRAKYVDFAHTPKGAWHSDYWNHLRQAYQPMPASYYFGFAPANQGGGPNMGGQKSGPVPVVITNQKGQDRPNTITTNVTVNVQSNASPQAIGGAVGSAVGSKVSNALSDQHH